MLEKLSGKVGLRRQQNRTGYWPPWFLLSPIIVAERLQWTKMAKLLQKDQKFEILLHDEASECIGLVGKVDSGG